MTLRTKMVRLLEMPRFHIFKSREVVLRPGSVAGQRMVGAVARPKLLYPVSPHTHLQDFTFLCSGYMFRSFVFSFTSMPLNAFAIAIRESRPDRRYIIWLSSVQSNPARSAIICWSIIVKPPCLLVGGKSMWYGTSHIRWRVIWTCTQFSASLNL